MDIGPGSGAEVAAGRITASVGALAILALAVAPLDRRLPVVGSAPDRARGAGGPVELRSARELRAVPGVGRVRARALVQARWALGPTEGVAWWLGVPGVGPVTSAALARTADRGQGASVGSELQDCCRGGAGLWRSEELGGPAQLEPWFDSLLGPVGDRPFSEWPLSEWPLSEWPASEWVRPGRGDAPARGARLRTSDGPPALASRP